LRWSATHEIAGPSIAAEPRTVKMPRTTGVVLKARCVSIRWKPTVTPRPVSTYMIAKTKMSFQPSHCPHTCQPTISRQKTGRIVTVPVMIRSRVSCSQGSTSSMPGASGSARVLMSGGTITRLAEMALLR
jgi:hypothetical protein